jgi:hypothetical protein
MRPPVQWYPADPRHPDHPSQHGRWGGGWQQRPVYDNQVGHRLPTGGKPATGPLWVGLVLFVLSPLTLLFWVLGQALLRATGLRWWKLALASLAGLVVLVWLEGGPLAALWVHFSGWLFLLCQFGQPVIHLPMPGAALLPQIPLSLLVGLLAAALNTAGRRQPFDPAEVRRQAREHKRRLYRAIRHAESVRDDHDQVPAFAAAIDGDLGLTARNGLVYLPWWISKRSRLIVGTSGMGKSVDIEREALLAARAGRKFAVIDGKGTDPGFVERALAGYLLGNPYARIGLWPELAMDGWRGTPAAIHNRLMAMLGWTEPYYKDIASLLLRLALNAPTEAGPVRSFSQLLSLLDPELLVRLYEHDPDRHREARSLAGPQQARAVAGAVSRFANFAHAVAGGFDGGDAGWSFEDVDFAYLRAPYLAGREDADACCRLLLEDFAYYATLRKPRRGEDVTLVFDEFSAIHGGRETAIQLVERVRDAGCALILSAQSPDGLGDESQQRRLVGACSGGLLLHAMPNPEPLLTAAGVVKVVEQTWRLDQYGPTGNSSARIGDRPKIDPGAVQQAREGEAWLVARGRYQHVIVARTRMGEATIERAHAIVALARSLRPDLPLPGARPWSDAYETTAGTVRELRRHLAIEPPADSDADIGPDDRPPGPPGPDDAAADGPVDAAGWRLRLAVAAAARQGDAEQVTALVQQASRHGLAEATLVAVARASWPPRAWPVRAATAGPRWIAHRVGRWHRSRPARSRVVEKVSR